MAEQEEGWPLGLQPINARVSIINRYFSGSISFNTLLTASPTCSSTDFSSDFDTESTGSFIHDKSITLGSLIGVNSIVELSRRSLRGRKTELSKHKIITNNNNKKSKARCFSWCASNSSVDTQTGPSLGHFLEVERKAANGCRMNQSSHMICGLNDLSWLRIFQNQTHYS